ncbi:MAG: hypothetical protein HKN40_11150 [Winogradskyella sp.]|uniref:hypothetical protein n=1 Tax=Winogradskyella sp. TaxID=1883156 RepID=UPI0017B536AD|nr:hypothetical protein [Winogradskyella sp.]
MKNVFATIVGFVVASFVVYFFETLIGHTFFPLPEDADPMDIEWIKNNMDKIPVGSKIFVVIAHFMGIVSGMFVAAKISKISMIPSYIVGVLMLLATAFVILSLPKELWFSLTDGLFAIVGFILGKVIASKYISPIHAQ